MENANHSVAELAAVAAPVRQRIRKSRSIEERRRIVEASLAPGATIRTTAAKYGMRPNHLSFLRKQYREGKLGGQPVAAKLLPVRITGAGRESIGGGMELELARGRVRIAGVADGETLRLVLELLR